MFRVLTLKKNNRYSYIAIRLKQKQRFVVFLLVL